MSDIILKIPLDDNGFIDLECPFCGEQFKLFGDDYDDKDIFQLFCPYCGLVDSRINFIMSKDVESHISTLAENIAKDLLNKSFKDLEKNFNGCKNITFKKGPELKKEVPKKIIAVNNLIEYEMRCCEKQIKVTATNTGIFCPFCGVK